MTMKPCDENELKNWEKFLNHAFKYEGNGSYVEDFAPLFENNALKNSRLIYIDGEIASSASLYMHTCKSLGGFIRIGVIGAVATAEKFRGQGLASQIIKELEVQAVLENCDAMLLWSDQDEFYAKLGFEKVGHQEIYSLANFNPPETELSKGQMFLGWTEDEVRPLYDMHRSRVERSPEYWKSISKIKSCQRAEWVSESTGKVSAYLGFNRGRDLHGIIHEWGGDTQGLLSLVSEVRKQIPELLWLTHPHVRDAVKYHMPREELPVHQSHMGLMKKLKPIDPTVLETLWFWGLDSL